MPTTIEVDNNCSLYKANRLMPTNIRIKQYIDGIQQVRNLNPDIEIYISDNSNYLNKESELLNIINENNIKIITNAPNNFGHINKGSGLIENWIHNNDIIKKYDYIIHFEPRQLLQSNQFIDNFLKNPRNLFTLGSDKKHFNTGLFCIKSDVLLQFIKLIQPHILIKNNYSIENIIYNYIIGNKISYNLLDKMDLIWFPSNHIPLHY
jgi:mannose-1-phosphate guanylyltransferase